MLSLLIYLSSHVVSVIEGERAQKDGKKGAEVDDLFRQFEELPLGRPLIEKARNKMASRDLAFRDALHHQLKDYVTP